MRKSGNLLLVVLIFVVPFSFWWWGSDQYKKGYEEAKNTICKKLEEQSTRLANDICA